MPSLLHGNPLVPPEQRANFLHLTFDIAWFGVLAASSMSFVAVFATRQGANALQIGLVNAGPAVMSIVLALPSGRWLKDRPVDRAVFWSAALHRLFYMLFVPLPLLLQGADQVWALIVLTLLMSVPGTVLAVGYNALFAEAVPPEWRGQLVGVRNALLSVTFIIVSLLCRQILDTFAFPSGYQVVFGIGFLGAAMSTLHLWFVRPRAGAGVYPRAGRALGVANGLACDQCSCVP